MSTPLSPDYLAQQITQLAEMITVACNSNDALSLDMKIAAMGFAARGLGALDSLDQGSDPKARMLALRDLFLAAFEHGLAETVADVETARAMQRMTGKPRA